MWTELETCAAPSPHTQPFLLLLLLLLLLPPLPLLCHLFGCRPHLKLIGDRLFHVRRRDFRGRRAGRLAAGEAVILLSFCCTPLYLQQVFQQG